MCCNPCSGPPWLVGVLLSCAGNSVYVCGQEAAGGRMASWNSFTNTRETSYSSTLILQWHPPNFQVNSCNHACFPLLCCTGPKMLSGRCLERLVSGREENIRMWAQRSFTHHILALKTSPCLWSTSLKTLPLSAGEHELGLPRARPFLPIMLGHAPRMRVLSALGILSIHPNCIKSINKP